MGSRGGGCNAIPPEAFSGTPILWSPEGENEAPSGHVVCPWDFRQDAERQFLREGIWIQCEIVLLVDKNMVIKENAIVHFPFALKTKLFWEKLSSSIKEKMDQSLRTEINSYYNNLPQEMSLGWRDPSAGDLTIRSPDLSYCLMPAGR